ncbi:hybrid sensor histidine kinase/response regulator transcription factor [Polaribacter sp. Hel1_85]|uniref:hybrid sensor histidine kinase/response regulator transcription factor n=1 Tax=Polaribacter sp. Hel1_85 TaxID=1250005 RepID=UPI00052B96FB|nr:hybrid sensor histidine kinase/response regulator transcription factor [Polaribacter sp. Hel1_85]KGL62188.1 one component system signal transduction histidine kinase / response regulator hybrid [Polaribacter sp. Hel1_85]
MNRVLFFIGFVFLLCIQQISSQNFERISNKEGFNQNTVNAIEQDKYGFLWYATPNGLIRYDGYEFKTFTTQSKSDGAISSNNITYLFNDKNGILWIGTNVGVNIYVPWLERFFTVPLKYNIDVNKIDSENDGFVWISSSKELIRCKLKDVSKGIFEVSDNILDEKTENIKINTFAFGLNSSKILGTNNGLKKVSYQSEFSLVNNATFNLDEFNYFNNKDITEIIKVDNIYWIGTNDGLYSSNLDSNSKYLVKKIKIQNKETSFFVNSLFKDNQNTIWIGTTGDGLYKYNPILNSFSHFNYDSKNKNSISSHQINAVFQDSFNVLWIGTAQGGINKLDLFQKPFYSYTHNPYNKFSIGDNLITSILEDNNGKIWVSGYNKKLFRSIDTINENSLDKIKFEDLQSKLPIEENDIIRCIYQDQRNYIWFGTDKKVFVYSPIKKDFKEIQFLSKDNNAQLFLTRKIAQINETDIVLSGNKIIVIENPWKEIEQKRNPKIKIKSSLKIAASRVQSFLQDSSNQLWFGTDYGLLQCKYKDGNIKVIRQYQDNKTGSSKISYNRVFTLLEDDKKNIWIGTFGGGLNKLTLDSDHNPIKMDYFRKNDVLPDDAIYGILAQKNSNDLWISTDMGLVRFNKETNKVNVFDVSDGLFHNNFRQSAYTKGKSGLMYFGGLNGLTIFNPKKMVLNKQPPKVLITSLLINNKPITIGEKLDDIVILNKVISETDTITVSKNQRIISFNIVAEHTSAPAKNKIAYKLEGFNKDWVEINKGKSGITYTNLSAGTYKLKVKSANGDGIWSASTKTLTLIILPLWYQTWWSYSLLMLMFLGVGIGIVFYFVRHEKLKQKLIYEQIDKDKMEVINQGKFRYFTNLSHEFRTPLTLISGPLDRVIENNINPENERFLTIIKRNTHRLLSLIDQLITFRQAEQGFLNLNFTKSTLGDFLYPTTEAFENYALEKNINFYYKISSPNEEIVIDVEKVERILFNLLSNSFKNTPAQGTINIDASIVFVENIKSIKIDVVDTGKGIPKENLKNIFERFYQLGNQEGNVSGGGVGLSFCKSLIDLFNGSISAKSKPNKETRFTVIIPSSKLEEVSIEENSVKKSFIKNWVPLQPKNLESDSSKQQSKKKHNILVVENELDIQDFLKSALSDSYNVTIANNGVEALEEIKKAEFSTIISDVMMPEMDGFELCKRIKANPETCQLPVLLLTALGDNADLIKGLEFGADEYISKPFSLKHLELRLKKLIENNHKIKEYFSKNSLPPKNKKELGLSKRDVTFLEKITGIIEENLSNSNFGVEELSIEAGLSSSHFYRKLKQLTGQVPNVYLRNFRLQRAAELLASNSGFNVAEVMYQIGIESNSYFSTSFKKLHGVSPSEYLKRSK